MIKPLPFLIFLSIIALFTACKTPAPVSRYLHRIPTEGYWQQQADYTMQIDMDLETYRYTGTQELIYINHSPDTLHRVFYHLYPNAFQPGSEMDIRSRTIRDPDSRVGDRISKLGPDEIGYIRVHALKQDDQVVAYKTTGTLLVVDLAKPLLPEQKTRLNMDFEAQVPLQIRRSGRNNEEGVALSMAQWYPKIAAYNREGWHADPYIGREFYGVWGNFDVKITIDSSYVLSGTGYLQNPDEPKMAGGKRTWHFFAPDVHDFMWAADPDFLHDMVDGPDGLSLNFYYKNDPEILDNWKALQPKTVELFEYFNEHIGPYPYRQYAVIQGGDGGMEYGMATLITGQRSLRSLVGVTAHEVAHSWFQFVLATNESKHEWMDEGFTTYISTLAENEVMGRKTAFPFERSYNSYINHARSGEEQPLTTHADRYASNRAYSVQAYSKGLVFLAQLGYVIGEENLKKVIKQYYHEWKFRHPAPVDFIRVAEKVSGMQLGWYLTDFAQTTNTIDYAIKSVEDAGGKTRVTLERKGLIPMPIDLYVAYEDGHSEAFYIPLRMMHGQKDNPFPEMKRTVLEDWPWADPEYSFELPVSKDQIRLIAIDLTGTMADIHPEDNVYERSE